MNRAVPFCDKPVAFVILLENNIICVLINLLDAPVLGLELFDTFKHLLALPFELLLEH